MDAKQALEMTGAARRAQRPALELAAQADDVFDAGEPIDDAILLSQAWKYQR